MPTLKRGEGLALINRKRDAISHATGQGVDIFEKLAGQGVRLFDLATYRVSGNTVWLGPTNTAHEDKGATYEGVLRNKGGVHWRVAYLLANANGRRDTFKISDLIDNTDYQIAVLITKQTFAALPDGILNYAQEEFMGMVNQIENEADIERKRKILKRVDFVLGF